MTTIFNPMGWANKVDRVPLKTVSITEALAVAYAAYRITNETYIKDIRRFEEKPTQFPNKDLVRYYWEKKLNMQDSQYLPSDFEMFEPTKEDYVSVQEALKWMKRYVMLGLGALDNFKADMVRELSQEEVSFKGMGRIAYAPEFIKRDRHESELKKEIRIEYRDSQHLGKEKDSVEAVIAILDKRYSTQWESYNYTAATTEGNLVSFMNKVAYDVGAMLRCKAKVKSHTKNRLFSANETRLNYVKLYKV
tara:strand:- start:20 stop:766 length:747 start_codon:yes stop_codon:yes gene_type:complete